MFTLRKNRSIVKGKRDKNMMKSHEVKEDIDRQIEIYKTPLPLEMISFNRLAVVA